MEDLEAMSSEELIKKAKALRLEANSKLRQAYRCEIIVGFRDASASLATANAAIQRAKTGKCTEGVGDCPVHQLGSCKKDQS